LNISLKLKLPRPSSDKNRVLKNYKFTFHILIFLLCFGAFDSAFAQTVIAGEFIVKLKTATGGVSSKIQGKLLSKASLKANFEEMAMQVYKTNDDGSGIDKTAEILSQLQSDPDVEFAEPNYIIRLFQNNDQDSNENISQNTDDLSMTAYTQNSAPVQVDQAWSQMSSSSTSTPVVAVIDTGLFLTHSVFTSSNAIWNNSGEVGTDGSGNNKSTNGIDDDGNGYVDDWRGWNFYGNNNNPNDDNNHGTHCAGVVLGTSQDILAGTLQPAKIKIMPLKFLDSTGSGSTSSAISAIYYAVQNHANVISNSWGGSTYSQALHDALKYAYESNIVLVAAAGNSSANIDSSPMYPAGLPIPGQITVAATTNFDMKASFSNYGATYVNLGAPGVGIYSTVRFGAFQSMNGTSMATPFVAGLAALAMRENSNLNSYQVSNLLKNSVDIVSDLNGKVSTAGRINAYKVIQAAQNSVGSVTAFGGSTLPSYSASPPPTVRNVASSSSGGDDGGGAGCGTVAVLGAGGGGMNGGAGFLIFALLPLLVWFVFKNKLLAKAKKQTYHRSHPRYQVSSEIKIKDGDKEISAHLQTISVGGAGAQIQGWLNKGGLVTLKIESPDGTEHVEVEARVVWQEEQKNYGFAFEQKSDSIKDKVTSWFALPFVKQS
jgi:subtilisin family serine protease